MIFLGVDIGVTGAIAAIDGRGSVVVYDIPVIVRERSKAMVKRSVDPRGLMELVRLCVRPEMACTAVIEDVHPMTGSLNSPQATGSLMHSRGVIEAVLAIARVPVKVVAPQRWKRAFGLIGAGKDAGRFMAMELFSCTANNLQRKKHHNRADALLLAEYARRVEYGVEQIKDSDEYRRKA